MGKEKRITRSKTIKLVQQAYTDVTRVSLQTAERVLRQQFGFGDVRLQRFRNSYMELFEQESIKYLEEVKEDLRRRQI